MKSLHHILVISYSQTGQLTRIVDAILGPVRENGDIHIDRIELEPVTPYPFPWPIHTFFDVFPECVCMDPSELKPFQLDVDKHYDLIILSYQTWFLSPSLPISAFLKSEVARVMRDTPVITVIGCKDTWLMAQETVKAHLKRIGAVLIDNIAIVDQSSRFSRLVTTQRWLWTGKKDAFGKFFPPAGIDDKTISNARRFGKAIADGLTGNLVQNHSPLLQGLGAVKVDERNLEMEKFAYPAFVFWARLIRAYSRPKEFKRKGLLILFFIWLASLIVLGIPMGLLIHPLRRILLRDRIQGEIDYYEKPSGSATDKLESD